MTRDEILAAVAAKKSLRYANLQGADLRYANLQGADLRYANLRYANLQGANLQGADLRYANLLGADLRYANLHGANLHGADLRYANLHGANLQGANLQGADLQIAQTRILPDGDIIGWKKCHGSVLVKLRIPAEAKRSHAMGRKCRAEYADVLEVIGPNGTVVIEASSTHDINFGYRVGQRAIPNHFNPDWTVECGGGIHFFITRIEAENY